MRQVLAGASQENVDSKELTDHQRFAVTFSDGAVLGYSPSRRTSFKEDRRFVALNRLNSKSTLSVSALQYDMESGWVDEQQVRFALNDLGMRPYLSLSGVDLEK